MIDVIVFDLGGVLVNVNFESRLGMLFDNSKSSRNTLRDKAGFLALLRHYETGKISAVDFHERLIDLLGIDLTFDEFVIASNDAIESGDDGIDAVVKTLSEKYQLVILSNTNPVHFEHIKEKYSIISLFDQLLLSYEIGVLKPDIEAYEKVILSTSKSVSQHLFIDDRIENIIAAKNFGMDGIQFKSVKNLIESLKERGIQI